MRCKWKTCVTGNAGRRGRPYKVFMFSFKAVHTTILYYLLDQHKKELLLIDFGLFNTYICYGHTLFIIDHCNLNLFELYQHTSI